MTDEPDVDRWADRLASRLAPENSAMDRATDALRAAVQDHDAIATQSGVSDEVGLARLNQRLQSEGLLIDALRNRSKLGWLAAAAAVLLVGIALRVMLPGDKSPVVVPAHDERTRGLAGFVNIVAVDREIAAAEAIRKIAALGMQPERSTRSDRAIIEFQVRADQLQILRRWAAPYTARIGEPGLYRVFIDLPVANQVQPR